MTDATFLILARCKLGKTFQLREYLEKQDIVDKAFIITGDFDVLLEIQSTAQEATNLFMKMRKECTDLFPTRFSGETSIAQVIPENVPRFLGKTVQVYTFLNFIFAEPDYFEFLERFKTEGLPIFLLKRILTFRSPIYHAFSKNEFDSLKQWNETLFRRLDKFEGISRTTTSFVVP